MSDLDALLAVQDRDTRIDQLRHRRDHLPERAELAAVDRDREALGGALDEARGRVTEVAERQSALERDITATEARIKDLEGKLYGGTVSATRDLQAMASEVDHLKRRKTDLEDRDLEVMEEREPIEAEVARFQSDLALLDAEAERLGALVAEAESVLDADLAVEMEARAAAVDGVDEALLAQYERLRVRLGGVGAARLSGNSCTGCHLTISASEVDRIRKLPPGTAATCEQCGRILVP